MMKKVYEIVFSPTGGTQKVADVLTRAWGGETVGIDLTDREADLRSMALDGEDLAVIAVPSYGGRVPVPAAERLSRIRGNGARRLSSVSTATGRMRIRWWNCRIRCSRPDLWSLPPLRPLPNTPLLIPMAPTGRMRRIAGSCRHLPGGLRRNWPVAMSPRRPFRVTGSIKKQGGPVWFPKPPAHATDADGVRPSVPWGPLIGTTPPGWTSRPASPACVACPCVPIMRAKSMACCWHSLTGCSKRPVPFVRRANCMCEQVEEPEPYIARGREVLASRPLALWTVFRGRLGVLCFRMPRCLARLRTTPADPIAPVSGCSRERPPVGCPCRRQIARHRTVLPGRG